MSSSFQARGAGHPIRIAWFLARALDAVTGGMVMDSSSYNLLITAAVRRVT